MAQALGTGQKGSVNVELNIVPFIDLMSCLTAFLLVTAVWINMANIQNEAAGRKRDSVDTPEPEKVAILLEYDQVLVTHLPSGDVRQLPPGDWDKLAAALRELKPSGDAPDVELAAASTNEHPIDYQTLIAAMDTAVKAGFPHVGVTDPSSLAR